MTPFEISVLNSSLEKLETSEMIRHSLIPDPKRVIVTTSFGPYSAVMLHLCCSVYPAISVVWVDHGFNKPETYRFVEALKKRLTLNLYTFHPGISAAYYKAVAGEIPSVIEEEKLKIFGSIMKVQPFEKAIRELRPHTWLNGRRRSESPGRSELPVASYDQRLKLIKINPIVNWTDDDMEAYLKKHDLPNEVEYYDVTKGDAHRECGLHRHEIEGPGANI